MSDRRMGERRAPEKGVIKLSLRKMVMWIVIGVIITVLIITNVILAILYSNTKKELDFYVDSGSEENIETATTYEVHVEPDRDQIGSDETVNFNISVKLNESNSQGIIMLESMFLYNTEYFDCKVNGFTSNDWELKYILNNYFIVSKKDMLPSYENEIVAKVSFTAKKNVKPSEQTISFETFKLITEDNDEIDFPAQSFLVSVK